MNLNLTSRGRPLPEEVTRQIMSQSGLTSEGTAAVEAALDPFHDFKIKDLEGWIDTVSGQSLVQVYTRQFQVKKDPGWGAGNWDCHLILAPSDIVTTYRQALKPFTPATFEGMRVNDLTTPFGISLSSTSATQAYGGLTICKAQSGGGLDPFAKEVGQVTECMEAFANTTLTSGGGLNRPTGAYRVISQGFEYRDDTAELYKQGSKVIYRTCDYDERIRINSVKAVSLNGAATNLTQGASYQPMRRPPINSVSARNMPNALTGLAKDGAYVVATMRNSILPPKRITDDTWLINSESGAVMSDTVFSQNNCWVTDPSPFTTTAASTANDPNILSLGNVVHDAGTNLSGCIISGLAEAATLTVTYKVIIEQFPIATDSMLIPLSSPSPPFDPAAMTMYMRAIASLPVGCNVEDNDHGDWWKGVVSNFKKGYKIGKRALNELDNVPGLSPYVNGVKQVLVSAEDLVAVMGKARGALSNKTKKDMKMLKDKTSKIKGAK
jgi:hypothetical protein